MHCRYRQREPPVRGRAGLDLFNASSTCCKTPRVPVGTYCDGVDSPTLCLRSSLLIQMGIFQSIVYSKPQTPMHRLS